MNLLLSLQSVRSCREAFVLDLHIHALRFHMAVVLVFAAGALDSALSCLCLCQPLTLILCTQSVQQLHSTACPPFILRSGLTSQAALALAPPCLSSFISCHVLDVIQSLFISQLSYRISLLLHLTSSQFSCIKTSPIMNMLVYVS